MARPADEGKMRVAVRYHVMEGLCVSEACRKAGYGETYIHKQGHKILQTPEALEYISELRQVQDDAYEDLWRRMQFDAPEIYTKYKTLAEDTKSDDVKRRIWADLLTRTGFVTANKLEITNTSINPEDIDDDIAKVLKELKDEGVDVTSISDESTDTEE